MPAKREAFDATFGKYILAARERSGMTRASVANMCGVATATLQAVEDGQNYPSLELFAKLYLFLDFDVESALEAVSHAWIEERRGMIDRLGDTLAYVDSKKEKGPRD